ncbi:MAG TPA: right-handed parallel beta-helix repeat-containing protein [Acidimicrobiales bacterium]|nr:right-handed parallel beta-helix repeat-containing protein [Acidimicrobiales bacterium]
MRKPYSPVVAIVGAASLLLLGGPFVGRAAASDISCGTTITANTTLTHDVGPCAGDGLIIGANNVTLDLAGHRLFGVDGLTDPGGVGVRLAGHTGVTITSTTTGGQIDDFDAGVVIDGGDADTSDNTVSNLTVRDNFPDGLIGGDFGDGITITGKFADDISLLDNTVINNGPFSGISTFGATSADKITGLVVSGNTITDNNSQSTQTSGIRLENWTWDATLSGNTITGSSLDGISLFADTRNVDMLNNTVSSNGFTDTTATHRRGDGIHLFARTKFDLIQSNTVTGNAGHGIRLDGPVRSLTTGAITVAGANDHEIVSNTATGNDQADDPGQLPGANDHNDLNDANRDSDCDNNSWRGNTWGAAGAVPSCTQGALRADLSVTKTATPDPVTLGEDVTYTVTVSNAGPDAASGVIVTDALPSGMTYRSATPSQGSCSQSGGTVTCSLGVLAKNASATVTIVVEADSVGTKSNTASATSATADPNAANNSGSATTTVNNTHACTIVGTGGDDVLTGTAGGDVICGLGGNDTISGGNGNDTLLGGQGNDIVHGDNGNDSVNGGAGSDSLFGDNGDDSLNSVDGVAANDANDGGGGIDTCSADAGDTVVSCP